MRELTPYTFREGNVTLRLTASQYRSLKALMIDSIQQGRNPVSRLKGFGPEPPEDK